MALGHRAPRALRTPLFTYVHITVAYEYLMIKVFKRKACFQLVPIHLKSLGMKRKLRAREVDGIAETGVDRMVFLFL